MTSSNAKCPIILCYDNCIRFYKFSNFEKSLSFINKLSNIAEEEGHHPDLKFGWGYAEVNILTHAINGLSLSDFILASKIDMISA